jgi:hypothetical protein
VPPLVEMSSRMASIRITCLTDVIAITYVSGIELKPFNP